MAMIYDEAEHFVILPPSDVRWIRYGCMGVSNEETCDIPRTLDDVISVPFLTLQLAEYCFRGI
jgi:hypothetical protein